MCTDQPILNHRFRIRRHWFLCLSLSAVFSALCVAQNKRIGTAAATELLIPVGGLSFATSGSGMASLSGIDGIYWNPAAAGRVEHSAEAMFMSLTYLDDIDVHYGAVCASLGDFGSLALSIKSLSIGDILVTTNDDPDGIGGRYITPSMITAGLTYGRRVTDAVSAGITVKLVSEQMDRVSASAVAFDLGVQYANVGGVEGLSLGVAIRHLGPQVTVDGPGLLRDATPAVGSRPVQKFKSEPASFDLPTLAEIGMSYSARANDCLSVRFLSTFSNNNLYLDAYRLGGEFIYAFESLTIVGGTGAEIVPTDRNAEQENIFGETYGFGIRTDLGGAEVSIDFAYRATKYFSPNHVVSVTVGF